VFLVRDGSFINKNEMNKHKRNRKLQTDAIKVFQKVENCSQKWRGEGSRFPCLCLWIRFIYRSGSQFFEYLSGREPLFPVVNPFFPWLYNKCDGQ
jgi:hypothetical protein